MVIKKVYIEIDKDGFHLNHNCFKAWEGFISRGYEVELFRYEKFLGGFLPLTKETMVVSCVQRVRNALKQIGVKPPANIDIPDSIKKYACRNTWETTLGEIRTLKRLPIFIKPLLLQKEFTGYVINEFKDLIKTSWLEDDFKILAQDVILNIDSEWRFYVLNKQVVGNAHYVGDPLLFPNPAIVNDIIEDYKDSPIAYAIDIGISNNPKMFFLIEVNDGHSLGASSLEPTLYSKCLEARWLEMIGEKFNYVI